MECAMDSLKVGTQSYRMLWHYFLLKLLLEAP